MNERDRMKRDREIEALFLASNRPSQIANLYGLKAERVRSILKGRGYVLEHQSGAETRTMWELSGHALKEAIWEKQREGARRTRVA